MGSRRQELYLERARIMKALAHPARLRIVDELKAGPRCVREIREWVGSDLSTVSKHLSVLKNAGILADEKRGVQVFYRLKCACVTEFFSCAEAVMRSTAESHRRLLGETAADARGVPR